jgi:hypothetical protein
MHPKRAYQAGKECSLPREKAEPGKDTSCEEEGPNMLAQIEVNLSLMAWQVKGAWRNTCAKSQ